MARTIVVPHEPVPSFAELRDATSAFAAQARKEVRPNDLDARDPGFIARSMPLMGLLYDHYFRAETEFLAPFPEGPALAVANHNAMTGTPDMFCHMVAFWRVKSPERLAYGLMHDVPFSVPYAGACLNGWGALAANRENATRALERGAAVLVFPGGDIDACKPFARRYEIEFGKRRGFIRTALRARVPIVPIVSVGAHHSLYIFTDGRRIAETLRLPTLARSNVAPFGVALPWGLITGIPVPHLPPPVKIHTRVLAPLHLDLPSSAADDPGIVEEIFQRVRRVMEAAMEDLRRDGRHGLFPRRVKAPA